MSDDASTILDYASPRKRSKIRLPAQSTLEIRYGDDNEVTIIERLAGLGGAYGAMAFGIFVLIIVGLRIGAEWTAVKLKSSWTAYDTVFIMAILWLTVATVLVLVIHQTWRRTIMHVKDGVFTLTFRTLLSSVWRRDELVMRVAITYVQEFGPTLAELQLEPSSGPRALLLTDHRLDEVEKIHEALSAAMNGRAPNLAKPAPPPEPDARNFDRLVELHRSMRERK